MIAALFHAGIKFRRMLSSCGRWADASIYGDGMLATLTDDAFVIERLVEGPALAGAYVAQVDLGSNAAAIPSGNGPVGFRPPVELAWDVFAYGAERPGQGQREGNMDRPANHRFIGRFASIGAARGKFRQLVLQMGREHLGDVEGAPWGQAKRPGALRRFLTRASTAVGATVLAAVAIVVVMPRSKSSVVPAAAAAAIRDSGLSNAVAGVSTGAPPFDLGAARSWEQLTPDQQQRLLRIAGGQPDAPEAAAGPGNAAPSGAPQLSESQMAQIRAVASIVGKDGRKGAPEVLAFEDPLCSACRDFAHSLPSASADVPVAVVPVAFQDGAAGWASKALCSPDVRKAWDGLMHGSLPPATQPCVKGDATLARNNDLFKGLGFTSTPVFVAPNGRVLAGAPTPAMFNAWYAENVR